MTQPCYLQSELEIGLASLQDFVVSLALGDVAHKTYGIGSALVGDRFRIHLDRKLAAVITPVPCFGA